MNFGSTENIILSFSSLFHYLTILLNFLHGHKSFVINEAFVFNSKIEIDRHAFPRAQNLLSTIGEGTVFSKIDSAQAFQRLKQNRAH